MLWQTRTKLLFLGISLGFCTCLYGWANKATHPALTDKAIVVSVMDDYLKTQMGLSDGIVAELYWDFPEDIKKRIKGGKAEPEKTTRTILEWLKTGSVIEDEDGRIILPSIRPRHHFYDPTCNFQDFNEPGRNAGLDNKTDYPNYSSLFAWVSGRYPYEFDVTGQSALVWATEGFAEQEPNANSQSWQSARDHFYQTYTEPNEAEREEYFAMMFLELGCILHMIEDMGVPAHTRNDFIFGHLQYEWPLKIGNPLEGWVEEKVIDNGGQSPWSGTGPVVFDKLAKYLDANEYIGDYLGDGQWPPEDLWGLAECTNYQFLSFSTVFGCSGIKYQFPHPAQEYAEPNLLEPVPGGEKVYFDGSNYGVTHLARDSYTRYVAAGFGYTSFPVIDSTITTDDVNVFEDYTDITIPRTIDYATGLANYFFRGQLSVEPNWADPNIVELIITNDSNNSGVPQGLKGGVFELYWDDKDSNRAEVPVYTIFDSNIPGETNEWNEYSILEYGQTIRAEFNQPQAEGIRGYTLVYKGSIGEDPFDPDPYDPNAVAVAVFRPGYPIIAWGRDDYGQVSDVPDGNEFIAVAAGKRHCLALKSDGSLVAWGYNTHGECNVPPGNDYVDISAGTYHSIALKSDDSIVVWGYDNLNQITDKPDGNDFVAIAAGDYHSLAIKTDGTIIGWGGWNTYGECNAPDPDPETVYIDIAGGTYHSLALQSDGVVKAWGNNTQGQTRIYEAAAGKVHEAVAAGDNYSFLLRDDDMLISWGGGDWLEPSIPRYHYRQPDSNDFVAIAAGTDHIMALTSDGKVFDWEWPFGDFTFDYFSIPVPPDVVFIEDIDAGYDFSVALRLP